MGTLNGYKKIKLVFLKFFPARKLLCSSKNRLTLLFGLDSLVHSFSISLYESGTFTENYSSSIPRKTKGCVLGVLTRIENFLVVDSTRFFIDLKSFRCRHLGLMTLLQSSQLCRTKCWHSHSVTRTFSGFGQIVNFSVQFRSSLSITDIVLDELDTFNTFPFSIPNVPNVRSSPNYNSIKSKNFAHLKCNSNPCWYSTDRSIAHCCSQIVKTFNVIRIAIFRPGAPSKLKLAPSHSRFSFWTSCCIEPLLNT